MNDEQMRELQQGLDRLRAGNQDAAHDVVVLALSSLHQAASALLRGGFRRLKGHDTASVFNTAWPDLIRHIKANPPQSIDELLKVTCTIIRHDLLDLLRRENFPFRKALPIDADVEHPSAPPGPEELAHWAEFHESVSRLPDETRTVFEWNYYLGISQADISRWLEIHPREVSRRMAAAVEELSFRMDAKGISSDRI